ncbi:MAG TPA: hypothetical protein VG757_16770 [Devosia sp.]|nr:hypothetical protein [Devosia sp.]
MSEVPVERGPIDGDWVSLAELADTRFDLAEAYFAEMARAYPGLDRRGQGAFFIGAVGYYLAEALADIVLREDPLVAAGPEDFAVRPATDGSGFIYRLANELDPSPEDAGAVCAACLAPLMLRVAAETRLGLAAQWRLLADNVAAAFLEIGGTLGCGGEARAHALEIVRGGGPLSNPQTGYHRLIVNGENRFFLRRGGCCRWFTADEGSYCATCVMRDPEEQVVELKRYLAEAAAS